MITWEWDSAGCGECDWAERGEQSDRHGRRLPAAVPVHGADEATGETLLTTV